MTNTLKEGPNNDQWRTLPEICMVLHMHHTGSCEDLNDAEYDEAIAYLSSRVEMWRPIANGPTNYCFDTQVLSLCLVTLDEAKRRVRATLAVVAD